MIFAEEHKTQPISKLQITEAFKRVKANGGSAGVDKVRNVYEITSYKTRKNFKPQPTFVGEDLQFLQQRSRKLFGTHS